MEEPGAAIPAVERQLLRGLRELPGHQPDICGEKVLLARWALPWPQRESARRHAGWVCSPGTSARPLPPPAPGSCVWPGRARDSSFPWGLTFLLNFCTRNTASVTFPSPSTPTSISSQAHTPCPLPATSVQIAHSPPRALSQQHPSIGVPKCLRPRWEPASPARYSGSPSHCSPEALRAQRWRLTDTGGDGEPHPSSPLLWVPDTKTAPPPRRLPAEGCVPCSWPP